MTIDEAIKHCEEVADSHDRIKRIKAVTLEECKCAGEHRQLAEWLKDYKRLLEQEPCEDCISRQAVLGALDKSKYSNIFCEEHNIDWSINLGMAHIVVNGLKSVTPQPKTGHWIPRNSFLLRYRCSECEQEAEKSNYCPNCGARMIEPQEGASEE